MVKILTCANIFCFQGQNCYGNMIGSQFKNSSSCARLPVCSGHNLLKCSPMKKNGGKPRLIDACGEKRLAHLVQCNRLATVSSNKFNSHYTRYTALYYILGCVDTDSPGCPCWSISTVKCVYDERIITGPHRNWRMWTGLMNQVRFCFLMLWGWWLKACGSQKR